MSTKLEDLKPIVAAAATKALAEMKEKGIDAVVTYTFRTDAEQRALYAQGRKPLDVVNIMRRSAGLYQLAEKENRYTVTNCDGEKKRSPHQSGKAVDIVPVEKGRAVWPSLSDPRWKPIADVMKKYGFVWGGDWKDFPDYPHYQMEV